jgi:signal transduction histidine kinase
MIGGLISLLTWIHYTSYHYSVDYHLLLQFGYYIPVIYAAIRFGLFGGIGSGLLITILFLPFMTNFQMHMSTEAKFTQWVEILLINGFGCFTGFLVDQERKAAKSLKLALETKEILVEKLEEEALQRQRLEEEVRRTERLSALGQLSTGLAHEIRNPLGIIRVTSQLLAKERPEDQAVIEYAGVLQEESTRLNRMLTDFLSFARPQEPDRQETRLAELVREGADRVKPLFEEAGIAYEQKLADLAGVTVQVDREQIKQVILNLLLNALEAQKESLISNGKVSIEGVHHAEWVGFVISDQGPGISQDAAADIFNPFFTTKEKGTGLGLSIVHRILEQHQGKITLTNRPEGGVRAEVLLPAPSVA